MPTAGTSPVRPEFVGPPGEPSLAANFVLRPSIAAVEIGNAFAIRLAEDPTPIVLTALHRFGPGGGLAQVASPETLAAAGEIMRLRPSGAATPIADAQLQALPISAAATLGSKPGSIDLAAFAVAGSGTTGLSPAALDPELPQLGNLVWLTVPSENGTLRTIGASVFASEPATGLIYFRLPENSLTLAQANANTGAPIVNISGSVVGMHIGAASDSESEPPYGLALSTARFLPHLIQAFQGPPAPAAMASTKSAEPN